MVNKFKSYYNNFTGSIPAFLKINKKVNNKIYCLKTFNFENNNGITNCKQKKYKKHMKDSAFSRPKQ